MAFWILKDIGHNLRLSFSMIPMVLLIWTRDQWLVHFAQQCFLPYCCFIWGFLSDPYSSSFDKSILSAMHGYQCPSFHPFSVIYIYTYIFIQLIYGAGTTADILLPTKRQLVQKKTCAFYHQSKYCIFVIWFICIENNFAKMTNIWKWQL